MIHYEQLLTESPHSTVDVALDNMITLPRGRWVQIQIQIQNMFIISHIM